MSNQALAVAVKAQNEIDVDRTIAEMKGSALARSNWEQLVSSAPIALRCLGACFMAASSKGTKDVKVPKVAGATLDRPEDLATNLVRCSNLGTQAFLTANKGMAEIFQTSGLSENKVYDIIDILGNSKAASKQLPSALRQLQQNADSCYDVAKEIDDSFNEWLKFTQELWEACQARSSQVASESAKAVTDKAIATQRVSDTKSQIETTKKSMEELGKSLDSARNAFDKASKSQPNSWDLIGPELVRGLGNALISGINGALNKGSGGNQNNSSGQPNQGGGSGSGGSGSGTGSQADPAYTYVKKDNYLYDLLRPIVKNKDGDVNWDLAEGSAGAAKGGNTGLSFIEGMLTDSRSNLAKQTGGGLATATYNQVLDDAIKVVSEMSKALKDAATDLNAVRPKKGSEAVVRWQTLLDKLLRDFQTLYLQSQNQPFSQQTPNGALPDSNLKASKPDANQSLGQAQLEAAAKNLETTAKTLETTNKLYGETAKLLADQQSSLMDINATLARLTSDVIRLDETKEILIQCIGLIVQLKARIVDLTDFFGMLSSVIKVVSTKLVAQWLETVKNAVGAGSDSGAIVRVGDYSLESAERTMIMNGSICIAAYFSFFADVAKTWRDVSERSIFPGIELAESLSLEGDAKSKMAKLDAWSKQASEHIKKVCGAQRQQVQSGMQERVEKVRDTLKQLPPPPPIIVAINNDVLPKIENADRKANEAENNSSPVAILTGRRRQM